MIRKYWSLALVAGMAVASLGASANAEAITEDREGMMELLRDVEVEMAAISEHAAKLEQMVEWPNLYTMTTYEYEWTWIDSRLENVGKLVPKLQNIENAKVWQKEVVDEIASLTQAMSAQVEAGMKHLNETTSVERLYADDLYELRIKSIHHYAEHIDELIEYIEGRRAPMTS